MVGYRGTMDLIFEIANIMIDRIAHHHPGDWPLTPEARQAASGFTTTPLAEASA